MTGAVLEARGLVKRYGPVTAVDGIDLSGNAGEVLAVLGPNGAGKTTAIDLMCGLRLPDSGTVRLAGEDPRTRAARRCLGLTPQTLDYPRHLKVREIVALVAAHYADPIPTGDLARTFLLDGLMERWAGRLSGGEMRRLALALAWIGRPKVLFLDEPSAGLDVEARRAIHEAIRQAVAGGALAVVTTHDMEDVTALADRVVVVNRGKILLEDTPDGVRRRLGLVRLRFRTDGDGDAPPLPNSRRSGDAWVLETDDGDAAVRRLVETGVRFADLEVAPSRLEDAILALLGRHWNG